MAVQEPSGWYVDLVKANINVEIWPQDDPAVARALGDAWRAFAIDTRNGGLHLAGTIDPITAAWGDLLGQRYRTNGLMYPPEYESLAGSFEQLAGTCYDYANTIQQTRDGILSELIQGALEALPWMFVPGGWLRVLARAGKTAKKIYDLMQRFNDIGKGLSALPKFGLKAIKQGAEEFVEESQVQIIDDSLDIIRNGEGSINWNAVGQAGVTGTVGAGLSLGTRGATRGIGAAGRKATGVGKLPDNAGMRIGSSTFHNTLTSPAADHIVRNGWSGLSDGQGWVNAYKEGAVNSLVVGAGRAGMTESAHAISGQLHGPPDGATPQPTPAPDGNPPTDPPGGTPAAPGANAGNATGDAGLAGETGQAGGQGGAAAGTQGDASAGTQGNGAQAGGAPAGVDGSATGGSSANSSSANAPTGDASASGQSTGDSPAGGPATGDASTDGPATGNAPDAGSPTGDSPVDGPGTSDSASDTASSAGSPVDGSATADAGSAADNSPGQSGQADGSVANGPSGHGATSIEGNTTAESTSDSTWTGNESTRNDPGSATGTTGPVAPVGGGGVMAAAAPGATATAAPVHTVSSAPPAAPQNTTPAVDSPVKEAKANPAPEKNTETTTENAPEAAATETTPETTTQPTTETTVATGPALAAAAPVAAATTPADPSTPDSQATPPTRTTIGPAHAPPATPDHEGAARRMTGFGNAIKRALAHEISEIHHDPATNGTTKGPDGWAANSGAAARLPGFSARGFLPSLQRITENLVAKLLADAARAAGVPLQPGRIRVTVEHNRNGDPAQFEIVDGVGHVRVSPKLIASTPFFLRATAIRRALAHEMAEIHQLLTGNQDPVAAHVEGRKAEMVVLREDHAVAGRKPFLSRIVRQALLRRQMRLLAEDLRALDALGHNGPVVPHVDEGPLLPLRPEGQSLGRMNLDGKTPAHQKLRALARTRAQQYWNAQRIETAKTFQDHDGNEKPAPAPIDVPSMWRPSVDLNFRQEINPRTGRARVRLSDRIGDMFALVLDPFTGEVFEAANGPKKSEIPIEELHPQLRERLEQLFKKDGYPNHDAYGRPLKHGPARRDLPWGDRPLRHAEIRAINMALHANPNLRISDVILDVEFITGTGNRPASCCPNCAALLHDATSNFGKRVYNPETDTYVYEPGVFHVDDVTGAAGRMDGFEAKANRLPMGRQTAAMIENLLGDPVAGTRLAEAAGLAAIKPDGNGGYTAVRKDGTEFPFVVRVADTGNGNPAELTVTGGRGIIHVAPTLLSSTPMWLRGITLTRALGHELSEINQLLLGNNNPDLLIDAAPRAQAGTSAHDHGRQTEMRILDAAHENATGPARALRRMALRRLMRALAEEMHVHPGQAHAPALKGRLATDVAAIVDKHFPAGGQANPAPAAPPARTFQRLGPAPAQAPGRPGVHEVRAVPRSRFAVSSTAARNWYAVLQRARAAMTTVGQDVAGVRAVRRLDDLGNFEVTRTDGTTFAVRVFAEQTRDGAPAEVAVTGRTRGEIRVSERARRDIVARAVASALAQLNARLLGNDQVQDVLDNTRHPGDATDLSAHDAGRAAELAHVARTREEAAKWRVLRRTRLAAEWRALVEDTGVHPKADAGPQRRAVAAPATRQLLDLRAGQDSRRPAWALEPSGYTPGKAYVPLFFASAVPGLGAAGAIAASALASNESLVVAGMVAVMSLGTSVTGTLVARWFARREKDLVDAGHGHLGKVRARDIAVRRRAAMNPLLARMRGLGIDITAPGPAEPGPTGALPAKVQPYGALWVNRGVPSLVGALGATALLPFGLPFWNLVAQWGVAGFANLFGPMAERYFRVRMVGREWQLLDSIGRQADRDAARFDTEFIKHLHALMDRLDRLAGVTPPAVSPDRAPVADVTAEQDTINRYGANTAPGNAGDFSRDASGAPSKIGDLARDALSTTGSAALDAVGSGVTRFGLGALIAAFLDREFTRDEYGRIVAQVRFDEGAKAAERAATQERALLAMLAEVDSRVSAAESAVFGPQVAATAPDAAVPAAPNPATRPPGFRTFRQFAKQGMYQAAAMEGIAIHAATLFSQGTSAMIVVGVAATGVLVSFPLRYLHRRAEQFAVDRKTFADRARERVAEIAESFAVRAFMGEVIDREVAAAEHLRATGVGPHKVTPVPVRPNVPARPDPADPAFPDHIEALAAHEREKLLHDPRPISTLGARLVALQRLVRLAARTRLFARHETTTGNSAPVRQARNDLSKLWAAYQKLVEDGTPMPHDHELFLHTKRQVADLLRAYLEQSRAFPGGRSFFAQGDPLLSDPIGVRALAGHYTVDMHGHEGGVRIGEHVLSVEHLAALLENDPNWNGQPIRLLACGTGKGTDSFAQRLADRLGVRVVAPTAQFGVDDNGTEFVTDVEVDASGIARPKHPPTGEMRAFDPRPSNVAHIVPELVEPPIHVGTSPLDTGNPWRLRGGDDATPDPDSRRHGGVLPPRDPLPMNMATVRRVAEKYGIDISGLEFEFRKRQTNIDGITDSKGTVILLRRAFLHGDAWLACTLFHEKFHADELRSGLPYPRTNWEDDAFEDRAYDAEFAWWDAHPLNPGSAAYVPPEPGQQDPVTLRVSGDTLKVTVHDEMLPIADLAETIRKDVAFRGQNLRVRGLTEAECRELSDILGVRVRG